MMFLWQTGSSTFMKYFAGNYFNPDVEQTESSSPCRRFERLVPASSADGDPGFVLRRGHQLRSDLHDLSLQLVKLQLPHQRAEQHRGYSVGEPVGENRS